MPKRKKASPTKKKKKIVKRKKVNHVLRNRVLGIILVILALVVLLAPSAFNSAKPTPVVKNPITINSGLLSAKATGDDPVRILIPKVDIDLKVVDAPVINGYWELSDTTASYGLGSGHPGTKSNTVIFAHARTGLFYNLKDVQVGDVIYVFTKNKWYQYKVNKITAVYPNQTDVIKPTKNEVLTLYTCTGFTDDKRLIVTAIPQSQI